MSNYYYSEQVRYGGFDHAITRAVQRLILLNAAIFALQLLLDIPFGRVGMMAPPGGEISYLLAFQPTSFFNGLVWQPITYMFLHANLMHLFFNMLWLYFFGPDVERVLGTRQFVFFYLICGAVGVMATFIPFIAALGLPLYRAVPVSVSGASGAVMGALVAYAMVNPNRTFFLFPLPVPINAKWLVVIVIVMNLLSPGSTSIWTHFGGMAVGYAYMKFIPILRSRQMSYWQRYAQGGRKKDDIGEKVDNIFRFDKHKRN